MANALRLTLHDDRVTVGGTVRGTVAVAEALPRCEGIDVCFERSGRHVAGAKIARRRVHAGPARRGAVIDFELRFPMDQPFAFEGHAVAVNWTVRAEADVPLALDPHALAPIEVSAAKVAPTPEAIARAVDVEEPEPASIGPVAMILLALLGLLAVSLLLPLLPVALVLYVRRHLLATRVHHIELEVPKRKVVLGEWIEAVVRFRLKRPIDVAKLSLTTTGYERWTSGSGNSRSTKTHVFHEEEQVAFTERVIGLAPGKSGAGGGGAYRSAGGRTRKEGPWLEWRVPVRLPPDGLPTVDGAVGYLLRAHLEIRGWPDAKPEAKLGTIGARLDGEGPRPEPVPLERSSGEIALLRPGEHPEGVDVDVGGGGVWGWVGLGSIGSLGLSGAVAILATDPHPAAVVSYVGAASFAALVAGVAGLWYAVVR